MELEVTYLIRCFGCGHEQSEEADHCPQDEDQLTPVKVAQFLLQDGWRYGVVGDDEGWFCATCLNHRCTSCDADTGAILDEVPEELLR